MGNGILRGTKEVIRKISTLTGWWLIVEMAEMFCNRPDLPHGEFLRYVDPPVELKCSDSSAPNHASQVGIPKTVTWTQRTPQNS